MGLVAAATDEGEVNVWDGWTGTERAWGERDFGEEEGSDGMEEDGGLEGGKSDWRIGEKVRGGNGPGEVADLVRSLVFTGGGEEGGKGESLLMARGPVVEEWGL